MNKIVLSIFLFISIFFFVSTGCKKNEGYTISQDSISSLPEITVTDFDGNLYHGVYIGTQIWMLENLRTTHFRDGTPIEKMSDQVNWNGMSDTMPLYCNYNNAEYLGSVYGNLYNRNVIFDSLPIAPDGWRVPNIADWDTLFAYLGGATVAGNKLRETGTAHWLGPNTSDNSSGFTALPGGMRNNNGYTGLSINGKFWSFWPFDSYSIDGSGVIAKDENTPAYAGLSIRCIKQ